MRVTRGRCFGLAAALVLGWSGAVAGAPAEPCPPLAATTEVEAALRASLVSDPGCAPRRSLQLGELLLEEGRGDEAVALLVSAVLGLHEDRGAAYVVLAEAQIQAGRHADALRSLAAAQRRLDPAHPLWARSVDDATLLSRSFLLRGGTLRGAYRFDTSFERRPEGVGRLRAIAADGARLLGLTDDAVIEIASDGARVLFRLDGDPIDLALADGRPLALMKDGSVHDGVSPLRLAGVSRPVALAAHRERLLVVSKGQLREFRRDGQPVRVQDRPRGVIDVAVDASGARHLLLDDARGVLVVAADGTTIRSIAGSGEGWEWREATAIAADRIGGSYILCEKPDVIYVFDHDGQASGRVDPPASARKLLRKSRALTLDPAGGLLLAADRGKRVVLYR